MNSELEALVQEARHPKTSWERLWALQRYPDAGVRRAVLDNPNVCPTDEDGKITTSLLVELAKSLPEEVAVHPLFVLHALVEPDEEILGVVVEVVGRTADVGLIETLWRSWGPDSWEVRRAVAENPTTQEDVLRLLGNQKTESEGYVRQAVARNPTTPLDTLRSLGNEATESVWYVRKAVASNPNTPPEVLRLLGNEETEDDADVRKAVASNPHTPEDTLRILGNEVTESEEYVRAAAKKALEARGLP